ENAAGKPVSGVHYEAKSEHTGPVPGTSESNGCWNLGDVPSESYVVKYSATGLVNKKGESSGEFKLTVPTAGSSRERVFFDRPGWLKPEFVYLNSTTGALEPATADAIEVFNSAGETSTPTLFGTPGGTRLPTLTAERLFPFSKSKYTVYAGSCEKNNPDPKGTATANDAAMGFAEVLPGGGAAPRIQLPALNLTVKYETGVVEGASVTVTDAKCGTKRTYITN